jgi:uncharacterized membrane protein YheB (UPF0754 family)
VNWFAFVLPPLAGALAGYVTNAIAIRMLFRPLRAVRLGPFRLPFTPGVLPRERDRLAVNMGNMASRELVTAETLAGRLDSPEIRQKLKTVAGGLLADKAGNLYPEAVSGLILLLSRPPLRGLLENKLREFMNGALLSLNVFQRFFVSAAGYDRTLEEKIPEIADILLKKLEELLRDGTAREKFLGFLETVFENADFSVTEAQAASVLESVDIGALVKNRIDSLDMLKVEGIILDLMADKFTWINLFGAVLGAFIGSLQVLLSLVL